jgi:hypothetical protein
MQGRMVDIEKLRAANESVQAVGNMNVNAKGDVLGAGGQVVTPKEKIIQKYYEQPKGMVSDTPTKGKPMPAPKAEPKQTVQKMTPVAQKNNSTTTKESGNKSGGRAHTGRNIQTQDRDHREKGHRRRS